MSAPASLYSDNKHFLNTKTQGLTSENLRQHLRFCMLTTQYYKNADADVSLPTSAPAFLYSDNKHLLKCKNAGADVSKLTSASAFLYVDRTLLQKRRCRRKLADVSSCVFCILTISICLMQKRIKQGSIYLSI